MANDDTKPPERAEKRYAWLRLYSVLGRNPKILGLRSDAARFAYVLTLCAARDEQLPGEFIDRRYLAAALGARYAKRIDELIEAELLAEDPDGTISVPQWTYWQPETPSRREEGRRYRANLRAKLAAANDTVGTRVAHVGVRGDIRDVLEGTGPDLTGGTGPDESVASAVGFSPDGPPALSTFDSVAYDAEVATRWAKVNR